MDLYSEQDYSTKFWGSIFETYLGRDRDVLLNWGEKMSPKCKSKGLYFKFDLRIMVAREEGFQDIGLGEAAKRSTNSKYYNDRVKAISKVQIPFVQIMGLNVTLIVLSFSKKKAYTFKEVAELSYPRFLQKIKDGSIQNITESLIVLEQLIQNLKSIYKDGQIDNSNQMTRMKRGQSKKAKFDANIWITDVTWSKQDNDAVNGEEE